jgi:hypothetical protein
MFRTTRLRMLMLAVVLGIAVASVAGITFSSTESKGVVTAVRYSDVVRFTVQNDQVEIVRAEVFDLAGKRLFDSGPTMGKALDWNMSSESGERVAHGVYLYAITAWDSQRNYLNLYASSEYMERTLMASAGLEPEFKAETGGLASRCCGRPKGRKLDDVGSRLKDRACVDRLRSSGYTILEWRV